ncbi:MAG: hypothetical protein A2104_08890 [Candidatus Melainabacteria bacterium GWF2_32_7]|nr:MAG: hypothetical protein A2104_08890 [Candidatus Melainabacteria bacterium GWF2_32_7]
MNFNTGLNYASQPSLVGTLVFPGRQSVLPASTVPEYAAQAYPLLNYSSSAQQMVSALGDDHLGQYLNFANFNQSSYNTNNSYSCNNNSYTNNSFSNNNSIINVILNFLNGQNTKSTNDTSTAATNTSNGLSLFDPLPISDLYGNQIPFNNAAIQLGLFGNYYGTQSIVSRYVADTMPTDKDAPGYTWKYTVPGQNSTVASSTSTSTTTTTTSTNASNGLSLFNPLPISDLYGNQIPFNNAVIQEGLFGNVHGVTSILSRYVADVMPTDKDAPGYTWKYTVPAG